MGSIHGGSFFGPMDQLPMLQDVAHVLQEWKYAKNVTHADPLYINMCANGLDTHEIMGNGLLSTFAACGSIILAQQIFDRLDQCRDELSWNDLAQGYVKLGQYKEALELVCKMEELGCIGLRRCTCLALLSVCIKSGNIEIGWETHALVVKHGYGDDVFVGSSLIDMYSKSGSLIDARQLLKTSNKNVACWSAMIAGQAQYGYGEKAITLFQRMQMQDKFPNEVTLINILYACSHAGLVFEGLDCFGSLCRACHISPNLKHYGILLDLLGRAGDFKRVENVLKKMPIKPDSSIWLSLLGICQTHTHVEFAQHVFGHVVHLRPSETYAYILMSNIYDAEAQRQKQDAEVKPN